MKALIGKELRENLKLGLPGFLIFSTLLFDSSINSEGPPLVNRGVLTRIELVCNLFGLLLGWLQMFHEKNRDLWAFLIHRPLTQTKIFFAKAIAGLMIYLAALGLPLLVLAIASSRPGQFTSPFDWAMALPVAGMFMLGAVWYFAGLLTGLRQARWYASKGLILIAALFIYMMAGAKPAGLPGFWQAPVVAVIGAAILAAATWGAFQNGGTDAGQPPWGRRALVLALTVGFALIGLASQPLFKAVLQGGRQTDSTSFQITKEGVVCKVVQKAEGSAEIRDLSGSPVRDPATGREITLAGFDHLPAESFSLSADFGDQSEVRNLFRPETRFYAPVQTADRIRWYWTPSGNLEGYDTTTRRFAGQIKPEDAAEANARFLRPQGAGADSGDSKPGLPVLLATARHVWQVNVETRATKILFTAGEGEVIGGVRIIADLGFVVVTRNFIEMLSMEGKSLWKTAYKSESPIATWVKVSGLADPGKFAVWVGPFWRGNRENRLDGRIYSEVLFVSSKRGLVGQTTLPTLAAGSDQDLSTLSWRLSALLQPPLPVFNFMLGWRVIPTGLMEISFGAAVVCAVFAWCLGRRYHFPAGTQIAWAIFHLVAGLPGFIAFLSVQEWPAQEPCPRCNKLRAVNRSQCEHCGGNFAPAEKDGTEIFEAITAKCPMEA